MTKQDKIKEAWTEYYDDNADLIDENGWLKLCKKTSPEAMLLSFEFKSDFDSLFRNRLGDITTYIRPKSLKGLDDNNGWTKIQHETDLPYDGSIMYRIGLFLKDGKFHSDSNLCNIKTALKALNDNYTHYQPIEKPKPPIY